MQGIIFVLDSSDPDMLRHAVKQFTKMLKEPKAKNVPILVYANKQVIVITLNSNTGNI